jgi:hypothetical protein
VPIEQGALRASVRADPSPWMGSSRAVEVTCFLQTSDGHHALDFFVPYWGRHVLNMSEVVDGNKIILLGWTFARSVDVVNPTIVILPGCTFA